MVDPNAADNLKMSFRSEDLFTAARNRLVLTFDEVNSLTPDKLGTLLSIATGSGFSARKKYADGAEYTYKVCRPILLNGNGDVLADEALRSRSIPLWIPKLASDARVSDSRIADELAAALPRILGALLDVVVGGLRTADPGGCADPVAAAAEWIGRCFVGSGRNPRQFTDVLARARRRAAGNGAPAAAGSANPVTPEPVWMDALVDVARSGFDGTPTELFDRLNASPAARRGGPGWPAAANQFTRYRNEHADALRRRVALTERAKPGNAGKVLSVSLGGGAAAAAAGSRPTDRERAAAIHAVLPDHLVFADHGDGYTIYGPHAEQAAGVVNRPAEEGAITVGQGEWDRLFDELAFDGVSLLQGPVRHPPAAAPRSPAGDGALTAAGTFGGERGDAVPR